MAEIDRAPKANMRIFEEDGNAIRQKKAAQPGFDG
jgi:hypothetical protein